jgi:hypothetical protein
MTANSLDQMTVLHALDGKFATKRITRTQDGKIKIKGYDRSYWFRVEQRPIDGFDDLAAALTGLTGDPHAFVIRGEPRPGIDRNRARRRLHQHGTEPATFAPAARRWLTIDVDKIKAPALTDPIVDPNDAVEYVIGRLPPEFHDISCYWHFTASQSLPGYEGLLSLRLWYWLDRACADDELKRWAAKTNADAGFKLVDPALYSPAQPHYTAAPIFIDFPTPLTARGRA